MPADNSLNVKLIIFIIYKDVMTENIEISSPGIETTFDWLAIYVFDSS